MTAYTQEQLPRWFKSQPLQMSAGKIDTENGIIHDVVMCQTGEAKGHNIHLEQEFIKDLISYDVEHYDRFGLKCRFGHPSLSDTTMGTQMGVFKNFRIRENQAIADLHLLDAADLSPKYPKMREWMLQMAAESPDFVMMSIVFKAGGYYQKDESGKKRYCWYYEILTNEEGEETVRWVSPRSEFGDIYAEFGEGGQHLYTDAVEAGAVTENLFSNQFNQDKFAVQAADWLQEHPQILEFLRKNPGKLLEFAKRCGIEVQASKSKTFGQMLKSWITGQSSWKDLDWESEIAGETFEGFYPIQEEEEELSDAEKLRELEDEVQAWQQHALDLTGELDQAKQQLQEAQEKIKELQELPAADPTTGQLDTQMGIQTGESYQNNPTTLKAKEWYDKSNRNK